MMNENNSSVDDNAEMDAIVQRAFDRLRVDAGKVNAMKALQAHEAKKSTTWNVGSGTLIAGLAIVAVLLVGGIFLLGNNESSIVDIDAPTATQPETPDDGAAPAPADGPTETDQVVTGSGFDALPGCGTTVSTEQGSQNSVGDLVSIETFDDGTCRRSVFTFDSDAIFNPDDILVSPAQGGGINVIHPTEQELQPEITEDRSAGFSTQSIGIDGGYFAHVNHGQPAELSNVTVLANPTRIIVDTPTSNNPDDPLFGTNVVASRSLGEVTTPFTVYGHVNNGQDPVVQLRQAPADGAAAGSGELVDADWSGAAAIGGSEVAGSQYTYEVNPFGWFEFEFTIDGLAAADYELVYLDPSGDGEVIDLVVPFSVVEGDDTSETVGFNTLETTSIASLPANFVPELDQLRLMTSAPVVLPTEFAGQPTESVFLTIIDAEEDRYELVIGLAPDCFGSSACSLGTVSVAEFAGDPADLGGQKVELVNGVQADLFPSTCGATCSDTLVIWRDDTYSYSFGLQGASEQVATEFAASARVIN